MVWDVWGRRGMKFEFARGKGGALESDISVYVSVLSGDKIGAS